MNTSSSSTTTMTEDASFVRHGGESWRRHGGCDGAVAGSFRRQQEAAMVLGDRSSQPQSEHACNCSTSRCRDSTMVNRRKWRPRSEEVDHWWRSRVKAGRDHVTTNPTRPFCEVLPRDVWVANEVLDFACSLCRLEMVAAIIHSRAFYHFVLVF